MGTIQSPSGESEEGEATGQGRHHDASPATDYCTSRVSLGLLSFASSFAPK